MKVSKTKTYFILVLSSENKFSKNRTIILPSFIDRTIIELQKVFFVIPSFKGAKNCF